VVPLRFSGRARAICIFVGVVSIVLSAFAADPVRQLSRPYKEFITGPTSYLITRDERQAFLRLSTDEQRSDFINHFWELRNPAPDLGTNEFQEEFNRRVAWANAHFGNDAGTDGWRSDRGKAYIVFGPPKQVTDFRFDQQTYPAQLWFYSNPGLPEVPSFFYVLFYDKDDIGGFRFFHPAVEGPEKLLRDNGNTAAAAYKYLKSKNPELARATLTLIPGEPIDTNDYSGSMESMQIINAIEGYRDVHSYVATIRERQRRSESVNSRITYDIPRASLMTLVALELGEPWLHYQVQVNDPKRPKAVDGKASYAVRAQLYAHGQLVFERTDAPSFPVPADQQEALKARPFSFEDRMPVAPGIYRLTVSVTNKAANLTYEASREVIVAPASNDLSVSDIVIFAKFDRDSRTRPFGFGGIKFVPDASAQVASASKLDICYQLRVPHPTASGLPVEYVIGNVAGRFRKSFDDTIDLKNLDKFGSLITAKELSLEGIPPGSYQLAIRIKDPSSGKITGQSVTFTVAPLVEAKQPILISQSRFSSPQIEAANDYERALCWLSQGRESEAVTALESSFKLSQNHAVQLLLEHLQHRNSGNAGTGHSELLKKEDKSPLTEKERQI
jgi:GWxTD domain-containing protein